MIALLNRIALSEGGAVEDGALALIARASEGSARDATSLLDQALGQAAGAAVGTEAVRGMLGLADRGRVLDLFDMVMRGDAAGALQELAGQYGDGADPMAVLRDLAEVTHWISIAKITPDAADDPAIGPDERDRGRAMAQVIPMRALSRAWQMLLKAMEEVAAAPNAMMAAEMALIRLTHVADLPSPEELMRKLRDAPQPPGSGGGAAGGAQGAASAGGRTGSGGVTAQGAGIVTARGGLAASGLTPARPMLRTGGQGILAAAIPAPAAQDALARYVRFEHVMELIRARRDMKLLVEVETGVRLVSYSPGRIEFTPAETAAPDLAARLGQRLQLWTGARWIVAISADGIDPTIAEARDADSAARRDEAAAHPMVAAVLEAFPKAQITQVRSAEQIAAEAGREALAEVEDEWDPFDDD
jgi:DNA polymerase-3 subunit gamma/tau